MVRWLVKLDDILFVIKWKGNASLIISYSLTEEKKILVSFNLYVNENHYQDIITSI